MATTKQLKKLYAMCMQAGKKPAYEKWLDLSDTEASQLIDEMNEVTAPEPQLRLKRVSTEEKDLGYNFGMVFKEVMKRYFTEDRDPRPAKEEVASTIAYWVHIAQYCKKRLRQ